VGDNDLSEVVRIRGPEHVSAEIDKRVVEARARAAANARVTCDDDGLGATPPMLDLRASAGVNGQCDATEAPDLQAGLEAGLCTVSELMAMDIKPRAKLVGDWFREGDLGFIFAPRGLGKTWLTLVVCKAISEKSEVGPWKAETEAGVLFVDGEMPAELIQDRAKGLAINSDRLTILNHELLFDQTGLVLNLTDPIAQNAITGICLKYDKRVLVLDNLSCLFRGVGENDADAWEKILPWLLDLRRRRIAVVIVAHSGRNLATMRGTSRREDAAFWMIRLDEVNRADAQQRGARFISRFVKQPRNAAEDPGAFDWQFSPEGDGGVQVTYKRADSEEIMRQLIEDGLGSATDLANEMGISKGQVSKMAKRLQERGLIVKNKYREYEPASHGKGDEKDDA